MRQLTDEELDEELTDEQLQSRIDSWRYLYRRGTLSNEIITAAESIPGWPGWGLANPEHKHWVEVAERLAKENGGILPTKHWLKTHGYSKLYWALRGSPELFAHIPQESKKGKSPEEHVLDAERLAKANGGVLPNPKWLHNNGYGALQQMIRKYPHLFAHIPQKSKKGTPLDEYVKLAEKLAKENGGKLQNPKWLMDNGFARLNQMRSQSPKRFAHIPQTSKMGRTIEENVELAEKLARENGGVLPTPSWCTKNGYMGMLATTRKWPERFDHIPKSSSKASLEEHVETAEKLAKENGGVLPNSKWLVKNGYGGLAQAIWKHPELFAHIPQKRLQMTLEESVKLAEQLAKENQGKLPTVMWLIRNGHSGLERRIRGNPVPFAHIPRMRLGTKMKTLQCL